MDAVRSIDRQKSHSPRRLKVCLEEIRRQELSLRKAADRYKIPKSSLQRYLKSTDDIPKKRRPGPEPALGKDGEKEITDFLTNMTRSGYPLTKQCILNAARQVIRSLPPEIRGKFKNDQPSPKWYYSFLQRHPEIRPQRKEHLGGDRRKLTEKSTSNWCTMKEKQLEDENVADSNRSKLLSDAPFTFLELFNSFMEDKVPGLLKQFENTTYAWKGDKEHLSLFKIWNYMHSRNEAFWIMNRENSTIEENLPNSIIIDSRLENYELDTIDLNDDSLPCVSRQLFEDDVNTGEIKDYNVEDAEVVVLSLDSESADLTAESSAVTRPVDLIRKTLTEIGRKWVDQESKRRRNTCPFETVVTTDEYTARMESKIAKKKKEDEERVKQQQMRLAKKSTKTSSSSVPRGGGRRPVGRPRKNATGASSSDISLI